jgi:hypothetical protein
VCRPAAPRLAHAIGATLTSAEPVETPGRPEPGPSPRVVPPASGIYGLIVTASVIAAGTDLRTGPLALTVFVTLVVYWLAEEYAGLVEHASAGHLPNWANARAALKAKWPIVSASYIPLATLLLARLLGAEPATAAVIALVVITVLLMVYGWRACRASGLHGLPLVGMTLLAGTLGLLMIVLKFTLVSAH